MRNKSMRNKTLLIIGIVVVIFAGLYIASEAQEEDDDDELYGNQINPDDLREKIDDGDAVTVYFYSPECSHCKRTTPVLVPLTEDKGIDMKKLNIQKYDDQWDEYGIEGTPTVAYFEDGEEVARIEGEQSKDDFSAFFDEYVLKVD